MLKSLCDLKKKEWYKKEQVFAKGVHFSFEHHPEMALSVTLPLVLLVGLLSSSSGIPARLQSCSANNCQSRSFDRAGEYLSDIPGSTGGFTPSRSFAATGGLAGFPENPQDRFESDYTGGPGFGANPGNFGVDSSTAGFDSSGSFEGYGSGFNRYHNPVSSGGFSDSYDGFSGGSSGVFQEGFESNTAGSSGGFGFHGGVGGQSTASNDGYYREPLSEFDYSRSSQGHFSGVPGEFRANEGFIDQGTGSSGGYSDGSFKGFDSGGGSESHGSRIPGRYTDGQSLGFNSTQNFGLYNTESSGTYSDGSFGGFGTQDSFDTQGSGSRGGYFGGSFGAFTSNPSLGGFDTSYNERLPSRGSSTGVLGQNRDSGNTNFGRYSGRFSSDGRISSHRVESPGRNSEGIGFGDGTRTGYAGGYSGNIGPKGNFGSQSGSGSVTRGSSNRYTSTETRGYDPKTNAGYLEVLYEEFTLGGNSPGLTGSNSRYFGDVPTASNFRGTQGNVVGNRNYGGISGSFSNEYADGSSSSISSGGSSKGLHGVSAGDHGSGFFYVYSSG